MKSIVQITYSAPGVREVKRYDCTGLRNKVIDSLGDPSHTTKNFAGDEVLFYSTDNRASSFVMADTLHQLGIATQARDE